MADYVSYREEHDDCSAEPWELIPVDGINKRIEGFPWKEEEARFRSRLPDDEPSRAAVDISNPQGRSALRLWRPCRHLMEGMETMENVYRIMVTIFRTRRLLGMIPIPGLYPTFDFSCPDLSSALEVVAAYLREPTATLSERLNAEDLRRFRM